MLLDTLLYDAVRHSQDAIHKGSESVVFGGMFHTAT